MPTHTRRSETSQALQQYSTPAGLSFVAVVAASIGAGETVLEPSAGTGMLAIQAELAGAQLVLNELAEGRAALLSHLFQAWPSADMTPRRLMIACPFRRARALSS
jgi:predicted RNA methylase